jgi:hypothetical protein
MNTQMFLSADVLSKVDTTAATDNSLVDIAAAAKNRADWEQIIDHCIIEWGSCIIEWGKNPPGSDEDDFEPPARPTIDLARDIVRYCRDRGLVAPQRVVPDGTGGIAFEFTEGDSFTTLQIYEDRSVELLLFKDCHLVERRPL